MAKRRRRGRWEWLLIVAVTAAVFLSLYERGDRKLTPERTVIPNGDLRMDFIDVGQGDSILLSSDGQFVLVDGGPNNAGDEVVQYLRDRGVQRLAAVVGTHPDADHIGGLDTVLQAFPADTVYMPDVPADSESYLDLMDAVDAQNLIVTVPEVGDRITLGEAELDVLWPPRGGDELDDNNSSIVLEAQADGHSALLTGDIEAPAEEGILRSSANISSDVLKVAHHGSAGSSTAEFLAAVSPQVCVISVGEGNTYGHPAEATMTRLLNVCGNILRTDRDGTVTITFADGQIETNTSK